MDISDTLRIEEDKAKEDILIFNPLDYDFQCKYDGNPCDPIISKENKYYPRHIGKHIGNQIVDAYLNTKKKGYPRSKAEELVFS